MPDKCVKRMDVLFQIHLPPHPPIAISLTASDFLLQLFSSNPVRVNAPGAQREVNLNDATAASNYGQLLEACDRQSDVDSTVDRRARHSGPDFVALIRQLGLSVF